MAHSTQSDHAVGTLGRRAFLTLAPIGAAGMGVFLLGACQPAPATPAGPTAGIAPGAASANPAPTSAPGPAPTVASVARPAATSAGAAVPNGYPVSVPDTFSPKPDLPSTGTWIDNAYNNYPANPARWSTEMPGRGGTLTYFNQAVYPPATALEANPSWQAVNKQLNTEIRANYTTPPDYSAKLAALMAGNDLPDMFALWQGLGTAQRLPEFLQSQAADLTPFLTGDAIKKYPNLAVLPQYAWKNSGAVINGHVYLMPIQQYRVGPIMFNNSGIWNTEIGANYVPRDADDFKRILIQLTRPRENRWAIGGPPQQVTGIQFAFGPIAQLFGAPNGWQLDSGGTLTRDRETQAYKAAVGYVRDLYAAGVYDPDQPTYNVTIARNNYLASKLVVLQESFGGGWTDLWLRGRSQNPPLQFAVMVPFAAQTGIQPTHFMTPGFLLANGFRKASADRIDELLRICNWLAAPFGTQEDLLVQYGLPGSDYTLDGNGNPVPTSTGPSNSLYVGWQFMSRHPWVLYYPGLQDFGKVNQHAQQALLPLGAEDPTWGTFSPTYLTKGRSMETTFGDGVNDIISGRRPLSDYDQLVKDWQTGGGDTIRKEYADQIAAHA
ncbi:MAG: extracellular solute-binding protein [Chloroflexota bacterium]